MKVYRILHRKDNQYLVSRANKEGLYLSYRAALNAFFQFRKYFRNSSLVIKEFELTNEKEI